MSIATRLAVTLLAAPLVLAGVRQDGFVEIREGLKAGERIVADGLNKIQPGQPVRPAGARRAGPPQGGAGARPAQAGA